MKHTTFDETDKKARLFPQSYASPHPPQTKNPREYFVGDIYERYDALKDNSWPGDDPRDGPYARKVKYLARNGWPQLRYLSDFMDCATVPMKQRALTPEDREERLRRVRIAVIDLEPGKDVAIRTLHSVEELVSFLRQPWVDTAGHVRLFVIEDLSTPVIELLGDQFNIDPSFFRAHISDYAWFNVADPWMENPVLPSRASANAFFSLRHVRPYYFRDEESAREARRCAGGFNVLRRIDFDKVNAWADTPGGSVGSVRARTTCYIRPNEEAGQGWLGFLLVDPPLRDPAVSHPSAHMNVGYPLWSGYDNIRPPPTYLDSSTDPGANLFHSPMDDFLYWTRTMSQQERYLISTDNDFIISPILATIPSQWLLSFEHITSRLSLIEWEVERREQRTALSLDEALQRLHPWRRTVVTFGQRMRENLDAVEDRFGETFKGDSRPWNRYVANFRDLERRHKVLEEKVDRIMSVLSNVLTIEEAKKAMDNARDVNRITYLAFIFVPFGFVTSYLSMNQDFYQGPSEVYWVFFVVALPLTAFCFLIAIYWKRLVQLLTPEKKPPPPSDEDMLHRGRGIPRRPP